MAISGRVPLLVVLGVLPVVAWPLPAAVIGWALLVVLLCAFDLAVAVRPDSLRVARELPPSVRLTESATSRLTLTNPGRRTARLQVRDAWPPSATPSGQRPRLVLRAGESVRQATKLVPTRRGDLAAGRVTVRSFGPLGLAARQRSLEVTGVLRVLPEFRSRVHLPYRLARLREMDGQASVHVRGQGTEFDSLREYAIGDDVRSVDWRASARAQKTMVRTWRPERDRHILIVLDSSRWAAGRIAGDHAAASLSSRPPGPSFSTPVVASSLSSPPATPSPTQWTAVDPTSGTRSSAIDQTRLDAGIETCLLMGALGAASGDRMSLLVADRQVRLRIPGQGRSTAALASFANGLSLAEPVLVEADWSLIAAQIGRLCNQRSLVILVTGLDPALYTDGLGTVLPTLAHDHQVVIAHVTDPAEAARRHALGDRTQVYDAAATARLELATQALAARVSQMGVEVVQAGPDRLAPAVCDAYLALKAAGRL